MVAALWPQALAERVRGVRRVPTGVGNEFVVLGHQRRTRLGELARGLHCVVVERRKDARVERLGFRRVKGVAHLEKHVRQPLYAQAYGPMTEV